MKILVCCKKVLDYAVKVRIRPDHLGIENSGVKQILNPFDEIALEESIKLKEKSSKIDSVIAMSIGSQKSSGILRTALAQGADEAIHVVHENEEALSTMDKVKIIGKIIVSDPDIKLVALGKQAIDDDQNQLSQALAGYLNWSQGTFASSIEFDAQSKELVIARESDQGVQILKTKLPSIFSADLRLNKPRYVSLQGIMTAKRKPIRVMASRTILDAGSVESPCSSVQHISEPARHGRNAKDVSIEEIVNLIS